jgi:hypothetical protein
VTIVAGPVVESASVGPGHDGRAELVVSLRHPNGAHSTISVDEEALADLLGRGVITSLDDLTGRDWSELTDVHHRTT